MISCFIAANVKPLVWSKATLLGSVDVTPLLLFPACRKVMLLLSEEGAASCCVCIEACSPSAACRLDGGENGWAPGVWSLCTVQGRVVPPWDT